MDRAAGGAAAALGAGENPGVAAPFSRDFVGTWSRSRCISKALHDSKL